jgi:hypothetical protein
MTDVKMNLRRSPRKLLERDGHPGPGPGRLAVIMARAGIGKTAFLVDVGLDALLAGQSVLHISLTKTVDKIRTWYDDILVELLKDQKQEHLRPEVQAEIEPRRHIHTYDYPFNAKRLKDGLALLERALKFKPQVILLDDVNAEKLDVETVESLKAVAAEAGCELWLACQTHRKDDVRPGHLPPPVDQFEEQVDLAFQLQSHDDRVQLHLLKDKDKVVDEDLHIFLDPATQLVTVGFTA